MPRSYASAADFKDVPIYAGYLERFDKEKNSGGLDKQDMMRAKQKATANTNTVLHVQILQFSMRNNLLNC